MALVQAPPVTAEPHQQNPPTLEVPGHAPHYRDLHGRRRALSAESPQDAPVQSLAAAATSSRGQQSRKYIFTDEEYVDEWSDAVFCPGSDADELREVGGPPPQLVPVSGRLEKNVETSLLLRPTAFKPFVPRSRAAVHFLSPRGAADPSDAHRPQGSSHREASPSGRARGGAPACGGAPFESSACHLEAMRSAAAGAAHSNSDSGRSSSKSSGSLSSRAPPASPPAPGDVYDGVVRDLEEKLRERELELQQLKDNLDENEAAICQVYEEKQRRCELQLEELRQSCATRMQVGSQKAQRAQQVLQLQVLQLQQEKKKLQEDFAQVLKEREQLEERCTSYEHEKIQLGPRLEESKWEVCQKSGEISLLKQQLKEVQGELSQRVGEVVSLRGQLRETRGQLTNSQALLQEATGASRTRTMEMEVCQNELQRRKSEAELLREKAGRLEGELAQLRDVLANQAATHRHQEWEGREAGAGAPPTNGARAELSLEEQTASFEEERQVWQAEKQQVLRYQEQLQHNYLHMYRRNRQLEQLLQELNHELDSRDEDEASGSEVAFDDITATQI